MFVLDTNILIYYLRREEAVTNSLVEWISDGVELLTSTVVEAELLSWPQLLAQDFLRIDIALRDLTIVPVGSSVARQAALVRRRVSIKLTDALIAATALTQNATLVTRNVVDFKKIKELKIKKL